MIIKVPNNSGLSLSENDVTPESVYRNRRQFMQSTAAIGLSAGVMGVSLPSWSALNYKKTAYGKADKLTPEDVVTSYNNFYELGTGKNDPVRNAAELKTANWKIEIAGHAEKTGAFNLEDILKKNPLEERIYRLRCVEAWSMVIPWVGFSLADMLKHFKPTSKAKYIVFTSIHDPENLSCLLYTSPSPRDS